jgi:radical SAM protein with 4Fe4S-binding SPASM domain
MQTRPTIIWQLNANAERVLSTYEAYRTIDEIASMQPSRFVIRSSGRADLDQLIDYARRRRLEPALDLGGIGRLQIDHLRRYGLMRVIFHVDSAEGDQATWDAIQYARERRLAVEIDTMVTKENMAELAAIVGKIEPFDIAAWNVDFGVQARMTANDAEQVFAFIAAATSARKFNVRACEAPQYARYLLQGWSDFAGYVPTVDEQSPTIFITGSGDVRANEFLPVSAGNVRYRPLKTIFRTSDLFVALRDARNLKGKCGRCDYKKLCGGSRARAWNVTGDLFAPDPLCAYQPS